MKKMIAVLLLLAASSAFAAEPPTKWYGGIGFGSNSNDSTKDATQDVLDYVHAYCVATQLPPAPPAVLLTRA